MNQKNITPVKANLTLLKKSYPLYLSPVSAGFPSPAEDYIERQIDLHEYLVKNPPATFFVKVEGDSMIGAGIFSEDLLVVDRSLEAEHEKIVIAVVDGELTVKRLIKNKSGITLQAENKEYKDIKISDDDELVIWGVVTSVIHNV